MSTILEVSKAAGLGFTMEKGWRMPWRRRRDFGKITTRGTCARRRLVDLA